MLRIFFVRCFSVEAFLVLREIVLGGDPAGEAEETPAPPLGKRTPGTEVNRELKAESAVTP
jgi:hypothetical protein